MLGGGGSQGNRAFSGSPSAALPPARRHQQAAAACWNTTHGLPLMSGLSTSVPSAASDEGAALSHLYGSSVQQRKRPGCLCDHYNDDDEDGQSSGRCLAISDRLDCVQPLDLSLPKVKVRQHWSGGSIVQVNDSTIISIGSECCRCPPLSPQTPSSRLNVSVVTVPPQSCWPSNSSLAAHQPTQPHQHHQQREPQPFRLQIEIPFVADKLSGFLRQPSHQRHRKASSTSAPSTANNNNSTQRPPEVATVMKDDEDDLQRLSDSAHQLRLSGYYYGHLSWKESMQLLHNTKVGTFLIRDSSDARYLYALSLQTDKGPTSVRIHYSSQGFRLDANAGMADHLPRFRTVLDLVDYYVAKWSQCRDKGQFWLDNSGQVHSEVVLVRPLTRDCPSLKHLCRLAWNRRHQSSANALSSVPIPQTVQSYLNDYPNLH